MKALIFGINGQDGSYLAELLLSKGYQVSGVLRRSSTFNTGRIDHIFDKLDLHYGDLTDTHSIYQILSKTNPDEVYNLAAQSHVKVSFELPEYTGQVDALGTMRVLEALKGSKTKIYQASTSEMFGTALGPQSESTPFLPCSPYGCAKLYSYWMTKNYRTAYDMHISNGILFNHESPRRGETFVTRKITRAVAEYYHTGHTTLHLGNLDAYRDWGHARDYVEAMWLMLQQETPDDYVIATGQTYSVRNFLEEAFKIAGFDINSEIVKKSARVIIDKKYYRPNEVPYLCGNAQKANQKLGWYPKIDFTGLVQEMVYHDIQTFKKPIK